MRPALPHFFIFPALLLQFSLSAADKMPVTFYSQMSENWLNTDNNQQDDSLSFQAVRILLSQNEELAPRFIQVSHGRAERLTKNDANSCLTSIIDLPTRRQELTFSLPFTAVQGIRVYFKTTNPVAKTLTIQALPDGSVSLLTVLQQHRELLIGVDKDRSYGETLDRILHNPLLERNIVFRHSGAKIGELWRMLAEDRVDIVLDYPFVMNGNIDEHTRSKSIKEAAKIELAYFACNKGPKGELIIERLNKTIRQHRYSPAYIDLHLSAVLPEQQQEYLESYRAALRAEDP